MCVGHIDWCGWSSLQAASPDAAWVQQVAAQQQLFVNEERARFAGVRARWDGCDAAALLSLCESEGVQFVDESFLPGPTSLASKVGGRPKKRDTGLGGKVAMWMRPSHFLESPEECVMRVGRIEPNDVDQGQIGNCWLVSVIAALAESETRVMERFFSPAAPGAAEQHSRLRAAGAWRVNLCLGGWWRELLLDDYLPCSVGLQPAFARNKEEAGEMWVAVLEKALAKAFGSYASIDASIDAAACGLGQRAALAMLTGAPTGTLDWGSPEALWSEVLRHDRAGHVMAVSCPSRSSNAAHTAGLVANHAFSLIRALEVGGVRLLQVRNPWGSDHEWRGDWSDASPLWERHPKVRQAAGFQAAADGTFWMTLVDFHRWFSYGVVARVSEPPWTDLRVRDPQPGGRPTVCLELTVSKCTEVLVGLCQSDVKGYPSHDAFMLSIVHPAAASGFKLVKHESQAADACHLEATLEASEAPYYVFFNRFPSASRRKAGGAADLVFSIAHDPHGGVDTLRVLSAPKDILHAVFHRSFEATAFQPASACEPTDAEMQCVRRTEAGGFAIDTFSGSSYPSVGLRNNGMAGGKGGPAGPPPKRAQHASACPTQVTSCTAEAIDLCVMTYHTIYRYFLRVCIYHSVDM